MHRRRCGGRPLRRRAARGQQLDPAEQTHCHVLPRLLRLELGARRVVDAALPPEASAYGAVCRMHSLRSRPVAPRPLQVFFTLVSLLRLHGVDARLPPYPDPRGAAVDPSALKPEPNMEWVDRCVKHTQLSAAECLREADASARRGGYVAVMKVFDYHLTEPGSSRTSAWAALADLRPVVLLSDRCDVLDRLICEERRADARRCPIAFTSPSACLPSGAELLHPREATALGRFDGTPIRRVYGHPDKFQRQSHHAGTAR